MLKELIRGLEPGSGMAGVIDLKTGKMGFAFTSSTKVPIMRDPDGNTITPVANALADPARWNGKEMPSLPRNQSHKTIMEAFGLTPELDTLDIRDPSIIAVHVERSLDGSLIWDSGSRSVNGYYYSKDKYNPSTLAMRIGTRPGIKEKVQKTMDSILPGIKLRE